MNKWLLAVLVLFALALAGVYLFIPSTITVSGKKAIDCNVAAANRFLQNPAQWSAWWPGKQVSISPASSPYGLFTYNDRSYAIEKIRYNSLGVSASSGIGRYSGAINILPYTKDTTIIEFHFSRQTSLNPISRLSDFRESKRFQKDILAVEDSLRNFLHDKQKVYGINFRRILNGERALMVLDSTFDHKPGTNEVNGYLAKLRAAVKRLGATEINHPMLHISTADSIKYFMMIAVQTNIRLELEGKMYYKHTYPGYVLVTDVTGGPGTVDKTIAELQTYIRDYEIVSPAIPYAEMITDRSREPDTSKWISRIFFPVF
jgi:hypothetical protein